METVKGQIWSCTSHQLVYIGISCCTPSDERFRKVCFRFSNHSIYMYTVSYRINCKLLNKHYAFQKMKTRHNKCIHHVYAAYVAYLFGHSFLHTFQLLFFSHIFSKKKIYGIRGQCNFVCFIIWDCLIKKTIILIIYTLNSYSPRSIIHKASANIHLKYRLLKSSAAYFC